MTSSATRQRLAIFPLANVVLYPGVGVPLHVFEARYRQLTEDALAGDGRIGMVTVLPDHVTEMEGDPPLFAVGCAGRIEQSERLPDGRYNIVLIGTHRFRIVGEAPRPKQRLYRVAEIEPLEERPVPPRDPHVAALRTRVNECFAELARLAGSTGGGLPAVFARLDAAGFANGLCQLLELPAAEKQGLLEAEDVQQRLERLETLLRFRLAELSGPSAPGPRALH